jgi:hypothetical protein
VPVKDPTVGVFAALLVKDTVPDDCPVVCGVYVIVN